MTRAPLTAPEIKTTLATLLARSVDARIAEVGATRAGLVIKKRLQGTPDGRVELRLMATRSRYGFPMIGGGAALHVRTLADSKKLLGARGKEASDLLLACPIFLCFQSRKDLWEPRDPADWKDLEQQWAAELPTVVSRVESLANPRTFVDAYKAGDRVAESVRNHRFGAANIITLFSIAESVEAGIAAVRSFLPFNDGKGPLRREADRALKAIEEHGGTAAIAPKLHAAFVGEPSAQPAANRKRSARASSDKRRSVTR